MPSLRASIVVIGDEILGGFVQDTNSGWMAQRLHALGVPLDRVITVPDEVAAIGEALNGELSRPRPRVILTSGGIGSTPDDVTMAAVAHTLGTALVIEPEIDARITRGLESATAQGAIVNAGHAASLRKMARVPQGAYLVGHGAGIVPGVAVDVDQGASGQGGATIVILPGIPSQLRRIVQDGVEPVFLQGRGEPLYVAEFTHPYPESLLNPVLERLVRDYPDVHVGSYPARECVVRLKGRPDRVQAALDEVRRFAEEVGGQPGADVLRASWQARWESR